MKERFLIIGLFLLFGCVDFSQRLENAAMLAFVDYDRVQSAPPSRQCPLSPINWKDERVSVTAVSPRGTRESFSTPMQEQTERQFKIRLVQRGAMIAHASSSTYKMQIVPFVRGYEVIFEVVVFDRARRPVAYNLSHYKLETPWRLLMPRAQEEIIQTMSLNSFVTLCAGPPSWQW